MRAHDIKLYLLVLHVISESYVTHHILWPSHFEATAPSEDGASLGPGYCCLRDMTNLTRKMLHL